MLNLINLLADSETKVFKPGMQPVYNTILGILLGLMALSAIAAIICVLMQPSNSSGIDALGGSSETFFGKNKGKSIEEKMKKWTWICLICLAVFAIAIYVVAGLDVFFSSTN